MKLLCRDTRFCVSHNAGQHLIETQRNARGLLYPFLPLTASDLMENKEETIKAFRLLEMILPNDTPAQIEFFHKMYKEMIGLFAMPYITDTFD
jgi:hypothetical protein